VLKKRNRGDAGNGMKKEGVNGLEAEKKEDKEQEVGV
jgi:hypothetical protein